MSDIASLEHQLAIANERLDRATKALAPKHKGGEWEEYWSANEEVLRLERQTAAAKGEQYAETIEFPVKWDSGAPLPQLMVNDYRALLAFLLREPNPAWDGTFVEVKSPATPEPEPLALVEFKHCKSAKLGTPNDEVLHGHPLEGKGLEPYTAQWVVNSSWLKEVEAINSVHPQYRPEHWSDLKHFIFWFHDTTFECIAQSYKVEVFRESMKELLARMVERLVA
jgi:hypothetical protein